MQRKNRAFLAVWLVLAALWFATGHAPAQAATKPEDTMAQRTLACSVCHGQQGRAAPDGYYPRIAGKPAGYLLNQLRNFRDGRRHYGLMTALLDPLSDVYLQEISTYFAGLDLPYPAPQASQTSGLQGARAEALVRQGDPARKLPSCASCHGAALTGVLPHVPGLLGLPRDYLNGQLGAWKTGQRRAHTPDCMARVVQMLSDDEVSAITGWLAGQALPADTAPARKVPERPAGKATLACGSAPELATSP